MTRPMDDIATIARDYFDRHKSHAMMLVDDQISIAIGKRHWPDVLKWQRVRHRLRRLEATRPAAATLRAC